LDSVKHLASGLFVAFAMFPMLSAQPQQHRGTVCAAPISSQPPTWISPGGAYNPATLSVKIDRGRLILWPHKENKESVTIGDLDLNQRHLLTVTSDGKPIQSLWFRFSEYGNNDLCVSFDAYTLIQVRGLKESRSCKCK
jgi:hypothetical protein